MGNQINKPTDYFNTVLYTGNSGTSDQDFGFNVDLVWYKNRGRANTYHYLFDRVRGANNAIYSNLTDAENNNFPSYNTQSFITNGSRIVRTTGDHLNLLNDTYASWGWLAGGTASSNTDGSITSTVSASTTSGFSIVSYTGNGSAGATVGHGLGVAPSMIIVKNRSGTSGWVTYHKSLGATKYVMLNTTAAANTYTLYWNDTEPSSSVVTLGSDTNTPNGSGNDMIMYCFAEKKGFSKFGSYTGNGSADGTFIYTGMRPAMVILKRTDSVALWYVHDNKRNTFNPLDKRLYPSSSAAEATPSPGEIDYLSNGFKLRTIEADINASGGSYIYMAFSEFPLVGTNNVVGCAR